jgi:hypothetical protein
VWKTNTTLALAGERRQDHEPHVACPSENHIQTVEQDAEGEASNAAALVTAGWSVLSTVAEPVDNSTCPPAVDHVFDYAGFMWDNPEWWQQYQPPDDMIAIPHAAAAAAIPENFSSPSTTSPALTVSSNPRRIEAIQHAYVERAWDVTAGAQGGEDLLLDYFAHSIVPPILAPVETQQQWSSMRNHLLTMARVSAMVRSALLSFSHLLLRRRQTSAMSSDTQRHHQDSAYELSNHDQANMKREYLLATCFFLSYVDILEGRTEAAHQSLKIAYTIFDHGEKACFAPLEIRILSWIRLLDGRAVSAGGEGLFLSDDEATEMLVQPSPAGFESVPGDDSTINDLDQSADIEDVLFQALYQPGAVFFQKVQSFMGRISKIDPWHRTRGTVADETEVMNIAANITKDLNRLFDSRPRLLDYATRGQLTAQHLSPHLSHTITRAFRTYASNFYASKVHLHRVAYKTLPLTPETVLALAKIRELAKMMVDIPTESGLAGGEPLPVNMLWPLLMLGSEEEDVQERVWIRNQICRMQEVATNAQMTAQVLDEVQKTQDETKTRVDIRSIMHKIFDACFAIV